jgi:ATP-dependent Lon protease
MDVFTLSAYSSREKAIIVDKYMLPRYLKQVGMAPNSVVFTERSAEYLVTLTSVETDHGMRTLEKEIESMVSRINLLRMTILPDGTTGELKLPYRIRKLKFPLTLTSEIIDELYSNRKTPAKLSYYL